MQIQVKNKEINAKSIVGLFARKTEELYGIKPTLQWGPLCSRVISMQQREMITWQEYYEFVESFFLVIHSLGMQPYFGLFVSSKAYHRWKQMEYKSKNQTIPFGNTISFSDLKNWLYNEKYAEYLK